MSAAAIVGAVPDTLVSVILPTYNRAWCLRRAVLSVLRQSHAGLELVVVDDCSDDDTPALVAGFDDPRVRYLRTPQRSGVSGARNFGLQAARGELVSFQDSDDEWRVERLARMLEALAQQPSASLVTCGYVCPQDFSRSYLADAPAGAVLDLGAAVDFRVPPAPCWLVRKADLEDLGGFDPEINCFEDWELAMRLSTRGPVLLVNEILHIYEKTPNSLLHTERNYIPSLLKIFARHGERLRRHPESWAHYCNLLGQTYCVFGDMASGRPWIAKAIAARPLAVRGWVNYATSLLGGRLFSGYIKLGRALKARFARPFTLSSSS